MSRIDDRLVEQGVIPNSESNLRDGQVIPADIHEDYKLITTAVAAGVEAGAPSVSDPVVKASELAAVVSGIDWLGPVLDTTIVDSAGAAAVVGNRYLINGVGLNDWVGKDYQVAECASLTPTVWTYELPVVGRGVWDLTSGDGFVCTGVATPWLKAFGMEVQTGTAIVSGTFPDHSHAAGGATGSGTASISGTFADHSHANAAGTGSGTASISGTFADHAHANAAGTGSGTASISGTFADHSHANAAGTGSGTASISGTFADHAHAGAGNTGSGTAVVAADEAEIKIDTFTNPAAAGTPVVAQMAGDVDETTWGNITQPDFPRNIQIIASAGPDWNGGDIEVTGITTEGESKSRVLTATPGATVEGLDGFFRVTRVRNTAAHSAGTCDIQWGPKLAVMTGGKTPTLNAIFETTVGDVMPGSSMSAIGVINLGAAPPDGARDWDVFTALEGGITDAGHVHAAPATTATDGTGAIAATDAGHVHTVGATDTDGTGAIAATDAGHVHTVGTTDTDGTGAIAATDAGHVHTVGTTDTDGTGAIAATDAGHTHTIPATATDGGAAIVVSDAGHVHTLD